MGRKDTSSSSSAAAAGGGKKEKPMSVSAMLASMDAPAAKAKSSKSAAPSKAKAKPSKAPASSYMGDVDLPPSDDEDEEARAARLEEENLTLRERLFLMERDMDDLRRRLLAVEELCRDRHSDGCVVDAATANAADEAVLSESAVAVASPIAGEEADTVDAMAMDK